MAGRPGLRQGLCLLVTETEPGSPARERLDAVAATGDGFSLPAWTWSSAGRATCWARRRPARSSLKLLSLLADEELIGKVREEATTVVAGDPELARHQGLSAAIGDLLGPQRAEFLDET